MFKIKLVNFNATTAPKPSKTNNVLINVVASITSHNQQSKQHVFKERESIKAKGAEKWQQEKHLQDSFIKTIRQLQHSWAEKQPTTINESSLQSSWVRLLDNPTTIQLVERNQTNEVN